jgi:hypothetical protein
LSHGLRAVIAVISGTPGARIEIEVYVAAAAIALSQNRPGIDPFQAPGASDRGAITPTPIESQGAVYEIVTP